MKITSFAPLIMSNDSESVSKVFEELGFVKRHEKKNVTETKDGGFRMKDADGHDLSIAQVNRMQKDMVCIRMNVDDFEETIDLLEKRGFKSMTGKPMN